jgi:SsrA-binding protein
MAAEKSNIKIIATNKKARFDYHISETLEAGLVLKGTEVKSLRAGKCNITDSYCRIIKGEAWIIGMNIGKYENQGYVTHDPTAKRKLLLSREEIRKLHRKVMEKGITLIPLKVYFKNGWAKVEIGLASGKRKYDKRHDITQRDQQREMKRLEKQYRIR